MICERWRPSSWNRWIAAASGSGQPVCAVTPHASANISTSRSANFTGLRTFILTHVSKDFTLGIFQARRIHLACVYQRHDSRRAGGESVFERSVYRVGGVPRTDQPEFLYQGGSAQ